MQPRIASFRDKFHYHADGLIVTASAEGGACQGCGDGCGTLYYCHQDGIGPLIRCETCARELCCVPLRKPGEPLNVGSRWEAKP